MSTSANTQPIRVGIFATVRSAEEVIRELTALGYTKEHIAVVCSDETKEQHFKEFEEEAPGQSHTREYLTTGSEVGALIGGLSAVTGVVTLGGAAIVAAGAILSSAVTGAIVGGLIGLMMTRGVDPQEAEFYDRAVTEGKILVSVEDHSPDAELQLAKVEEIFERHGVEPVELRDK